MNIRMLFHRLYVLQQQSWNDCRSLYKRYVKPVCTCVFVFVFVFVFRLSLVLDLGSVSHLVRRHHSYTRTGGHYHLLRLREEATQ